jgi:DNA-binding response OmpR family regulator
MQYTLHGKRIDVMLLDYRLDDSTGDDIACKLRDLDGTKIIMMISYDLEREKVDTLKTSNCIVEMLVKPVSVKALIERVQQALD